MYVCRSDNVIVYGMRYLLIKGDRVVGDSELLMIRHFTSVSAVKSILKKGFLFPSFLIFHTISTKASNNVELRINVMEGKYAVKTWFLTILRPQYFA